MVLPLSDLEHSRQVSIDIGDVQLTGDLIVPHSAQAIVVFAHGSGSSRQSPRNRYVASQLRGDGRLGTLLFDLLTPQEELAELDTRHLRFDIELLSERLARTTDWLVTRPQGEGLPVGYFGASTGAAAALVVAAQEPDLVASLVSRGGRPDLAGDRLASVRTPTLLLVGQRDEAVLELNEAALDRFPPDTPRELVRVAGASHLFEEPGALETVAREARRWFARTLLADH